MVTNRKVTGKAASMPVGIGTGLAVSLLLTVAGAAVVAMLLSGGQLGEESIGYGSLAILLVSSFAGAFVSVGMIKHRRLVVCAAAGISYYLAMLLLNALCFGGQYEGAGVTALVVLAGTGLVVLIGMKG